jgi:phage terminase large subunit
MAISDRQIVIPYAPRRIFLPYHERTQRWSAIVAHRRCGKTVACVNDLIRAAITLEKPDGRYAYIAPLFNQAKDVAWLYLKRYAQPLLASPPNETELRIDLLNGSRIRLYGADNPDRLRGIYLDGVVLDEYAQMAPSLWGEVIRPLLTDRQGWATFIGTPKGKDKFGFWGIYD